MRAAVTANINTHEVDVDYLAEVFDMRHIMLAVPFFNIRDQSAADAGIIM